MVRLVYRKCKLIDFCELFPTYLLDTIVVVLKVKVGVNDSNVVRPVIVPQRPVITPIVTSSASKSTTLAPRVVESSRSKKKRRRQGNKLFIYKENISFFICNLVNSSKPI